MTNIDRQEGIMIRKLDDKIIMDKEDYMAILEEKDRLLTEGGRLRKLLDKYGRHQSLCYQMEVGGDEHCNCGWRDEKKTIWPDPASDKHNPQCDAEVSSLSEVSDKQEPFGEMFHSDGKDLLVDAVADGLYHCPKHGWYTDNPCPMCVAADDGRALVPCAKCGAMYDGVDNCSACPDCVSADDRREFAEDIGCPYPNCGWTGKSCDICGPAADDRQHLLSFFEREVARLSVGDIASYAYPPKSPERYTDEGWKKVTSADPGREQ